jgi:hypothetical protein
MRLGVVADEMAGGVDAANDILPLAHESANHEERSVSVVVSKEVKERVGGDVVRAIVVGERDLVWIIARDNRVAEELGSRAERSVGQCAGCGCGYDGGSAT